MFGFLGHFCATVLFLLYMLWLHTFPQQDSVIQTDRNWVAQVCGYRNCTMSFMPWIVSRQTWSASNKKKSHLIAQCHGGVCFLYHLLSCWFSFTDLYGMKGVLTIELLSSHIAVFVFLLISLGFYSDTSVIYVFEGSRPFWEDAQLSLVCKHEGFFDKATSSTMSNYHTAIVQM